VIGLEWVVGEGVLYHSGCGTGVIGVARWWGILLET